MKEKEPKKKIEITKVITIVFIVIIIAYYAGWLDFSGQKKTPEKSSSHTTESVEMRTKALKN